MKTLTAEERVAQEKASLEVLAKNSQSHHFNHEGLELLIRKDVFSPHYLNGWHTFSPALLKQIKPKQSLLEVGSGSGITALMAAKAGAEVSTCDINPIAVPFSGRKYEEIVTIHEAYHHLAKQYDLELLEQFIGIEEKEKFENAEYEPVFIVNTDFKLLEQSQLLLMDLQQISVGACFEMAYAKNTRSIPVIGFNCTDVLTQKHPWYAYHCDKIYPNLEETLTYAHDYCCTP